LTYGYGLGRVTHAQKRVGSGSKKYVPAVLYLLPSAGREMSSSYDYWVNRRPKEADWGKGVSVSYIMDPVVR